MYFWQVGTGKVSGSGKDLTIKWATLYFQPLMNEVAGKFRRDGYNSAG